MSVVVVLLLVVLWAWILLPGAVRERRETSTTSSVSRFKRSMAHLAHANPAPPEFTGDEDGRNGQGIPGSGSAPREEVAGRAARRRRQVLTSLTAAATLALIAARSFGGPSWVAFWVVMALLTTYLALLGHRWVRISRADALPLVRPPDPEDLPTLAPSFADEAGPFGAGWTRDGAERPLRSDGASPPERVQIPDRVRIPKGVRVIDW